MLALLLVATGVAISWRVQQKPFTVWEAQVGAIRNSRQNAHTREVQNIAIQRVVDKHRIHTVLTGEQATSKSFADRLSAQDLDDLGKLVDGGEVADRATAEINLGVIKVLSKPKKEKK